MNNLYFDFYNSFKTFIFTRIISIFLIFLLSLDISSAFLSVNLISIKYEISLLRSEVELRKLIGSLYLKLV